MSYRYSFEDLLALLHGHAPAKVDAVALHRRRVEHGHLSVGLKIHCLGDGSQFSTPAIRLRAAFAWTLEADRTLRMRTRLLLDMSKLLSTVPAQQRAATTQTPRRPMGAGGGEERAGLARCP